VKEERQKCRRLNQSNKENIKKEKRVAKKEKQKILERRK
jgi:hypothetical protein